MVRFLCVTLNPGGGALGPALTSLGFKCFDARQAFKATGNGPSNRADPGKWVPVIKGRRHFDIKMVQDHEVAVGMPTSSCWEAVYRKCPDYTKVILVVEPDKRKWATEVLTEVLPTVEHLENIEFRAGKEAANFFRNMYPSEVITPTDMSFSKVRKQREDAHKRQIELDIAAKKLRQSEGKVSLAGTVRKLENDAELTFTPTKLTEEEIRESARTIQKKAKEGAHGRPPMTMTDEESLEEAQALEEMTIMMMEGLNDWEFNVKDTVRNKSKLLVFTPGKDSWEELCRYVDKEVPISFDLDKGEDAVTKFPEHNAGKAEIDHFIETAQKAATIAFRMRLGVVLSLLGLVAYVVLSPVLNAKDGFMQEMMEMQKDFNEAFGDAGAEEQKKWEEEQEELKAQKK